VVEVIGGEYIVVTRTTRFDGFMGMGPSHPAFKKGSKVRPPTATQAAYEQAFKIILPHV
jgi:hypothetical protein